MAAGDAEGKKVSRRRFLKWAGGLAIVGAAGVELGAATKGLFGKGLQRSADGAAGAIGQRTQPGAAGIVTDAYTTPRMTISPLSSATATSVPQVGTPPAPYGFSVFWITDTQFLSEENPGLYKMMMNWIVNHWEEYNGQLVIHTGDMVQTGGSQQQWANANDAMSIFLQNGIPYTWCAGNHDDLVQDDNTSGWMGNVWGAPAFDPVFVGTAINNNVYPTGSDSYGVQFTPGGNVQWVSDFHNGMDTAVSFTANDTNFLVINVEWIAGPDAISWVESLLSSEQYANYRVIVAMHAYIDSYGYLNDARWGQEMADFMAGMTPLLDQYSSNIFLTLNGHFASESGYNTPSPINGRNELLFDRQDCADYPNDITGRSVDSVTAGTSDADKVGGATVTILNFDTLNNQIHVSTYDVYRGQWRVDEPNQYSIAMFPTIPSQNPYVPPSSVAANPA